MVKEGLLRAYILNNRDAPLYPEETEELKKHKKEYYGTESVKVLLKIIKFKNP
jgi:hypothetical protein